MANIEHRDLPMPDGACDVVRGLPDGASDGDERAFPPVLFLMDAVGLRPRLVDMVATVADLGYAVLAPNLFYRTGRQPLIPPELLAPGSDNARRLAMGRLLAAYGLRHWAVDGAAYLDHLRSWPAARDEPVRVVGYCMGGRYGVHLAAQLPDRVACVAGYHPGGLVTDAPDSPHRRLGSVRCPLYLGYADQDSSATPRMQAQFATACREAGVTLRAEVYADARHGFTMADLPAYNADACARHWKTLREFFAGA